MSTVPMPWAVAADAPAPANSGGVAPTVRAVGWGEADFDAAQARVASLAALGSPWVLVPARVTLRPDGSVVVEERALAGTSLASVLAHRGSLRAGECVWWGTGVAEALAVLHRGGLAHGALDAEAVWIGDDGVQLRGAGFAPPAREGSDDAPARRIEDAAADVAALGALLATSVRPDDASRVRAWAEPMCHPDPVSRPTAAMVARALASCAAPEEVRPAPLGIATALRRAALEQDDDGEAPYRASGVERLPEARWWRLRRALLSAAAFVPLRRHARHVRARRVVALAGALGAAGALVAGVVLAVSALGGAAEEPRAAVARGEATGGLHGDRPAFAAAALALARVDALAAGDGEELIALTAEGSPARAEAAATAESLAAGEVSFHGLAAAVEDVQVRSAPHGAPRQGDEATVVVAISVTAYQLTQGGAVTPMPESTERTVITLTYDAGAGWRVSAAGPAVG